MNLLKLSWSYLKAKPFATLLSTILVALGVSLTSILFLLNQQFQDRLYRNIDGIDLVVGAKGSPLQMILSSVYHIDAPTGNIPLKEAYVVTKNPFVEKAIPLALGDSYKGFRIVGTDSQYLDHFGAKVAQGRRIERDLEVVVGDRAARQLKLQLGNTFYGSHGLVQDGGHVHETYAYEVVGILAPTNLVLDQLITTTVPTVWRMHADHGHDEGDHEEEAHDHDHEGHDHSSPEHVHDHNTPNTSVDQHDHGAHDQQHQHKNPVNLPPISKEGKEVTAYLVQYKKDGEGNTSMRATVEAPMIIEDNSTSLGYAKPAIELQRLLEMTGVGMDFLRALALIIILISAFSMFISLYSSLKERRYEMALMRVQGARPRQLFAMIILEGLLVALVGFVIGLLISHLGMEIMAAQLEDTYKYTFTGWLFLPEEALLFVGTLVIGFLAAILPALQAYHVDISATLSEG